MEILVVSLAALFASVLTLFSGFGLGTLLMPVVALFFPVEVAIAVTAMVHLANNLFKAALFARQADHAVLASFGIPAILAAFLGALLLGWLSDIPPLISYAAFGRELQVSPVKLVVGLLILVFVALDLFPKLSSVALDRKYLPLGGMVSGFFGGLSGHQGAFRSMFLLKAGLGKEVFVATGVMLAVMVDISRMLVYGWAAARWGSGIEWPLVVSATLAAFCGAYFGARLLRKVTLRFVQLTVSMLLGVVSVGMMSGML